MFLLGPKLALEMPNQLTSADQKDQPKGKRSCFRKVSRYINKLRRRFDCTTARTNSLSRRYVMSGGYGFAFEFEDSVRSWCSVSIKGQDFTSSGEHAWNLPENLWSVQASDDEHEQDEEDKPQPEGSDERIQLKSESLKRLVWIGEKEGVAKGGPEDLGVEAKSESYNRMYWIGGSHALAYQAASMSWRTRTVMLQALNSCSESELPSYQSQRKSSFDSPCKIVTEDILTRAIQKADLSRKSGDRSPDEVLKKMDIGRQRLADTEEIQIHEELKKVIGGRQLGSAKEGIEIQRFHFSDDADLKKVGIGRFHSSDEDDLKKVGSKQLAVKEEIQIPALKQEKLSAQTDEERTFRIIVVFGVVLCRVIIGIVLWHEQKKLAKAREVEQQVELYCRSPRKNFKPVVEAQQLELYCKAPKTNYVRAVEAQDLELYCRWPRRKLHTNVPHRTTPSGSEFKAVLCG